MRRSYLLSIGLFLIFGCTKTETKPADTNEKLNKECDNANLQSCYDLGLAKLAIKDFDTAKILFKKVCDGDGLPGCVNLGAIFATSGDNKQASLLFEKACNGNNIDGCLNAGSLAGNSGDSASATIFFTKACNAGNKDGCTFLEKLKSMPANTEKTASIPFDVLRNFDTVREFEKPGVMVAFLGIVKSIQTVQENSVYEVDVYNANLKLTNTVYVLGVEKNEGFASIGAKIRFLGCPAEDFRASIVKDYKIPKSAPIFSATALFNPATKKTSFIPGSERSFQIWKDVEIPRIKCTLEK